MDCKHQILNFIIDECLDAVEEIHEKVQLLDITTTLSVRQHLSLLMDNYLLFLADILNMLASFDKNEEFLLKNW